MSDAEESLPQSLLDEEEAGEHEWPERGVLARLWEGHRASRERLVLGELCQLTRWPSPACVGVPSVRAMALNSDILEMLASIWCPVRSAPKAVPINYLRQEAG